MREPHGDHPKPLEHDDFVRLAEALLALPLITEDPKLRARVLTLCQADEVLNAQEFELRRARGTHEPLPVMARESLTALTYLWLDGLDGLLRDWENRRWTLQHAHETAENDEVDVRALVPLSLSDVADRFHDDPDYRAAVEVTREQLRGTDFALRDLLEPQRNPPPCAEAERIGQAWAGGAIAPETGAVHLKANGWRIGVATRRAVTDALRLGVLKVDRRHRPVSAVEPVEQQPRA